MLALGGCNAMTEVAWGEPALISQTWRFSGMSDAVDIFNVKSETWTTAVLSVARQTTAATSLLNEGLAIFAGGQGALFLHNVFACDFDFVCGNGGEWGFECDGRGSAW